MSTIDVRVTGYRRERTALGLNLDLGTQRLEGKGIDVGWTESSSKVYPGRDINTASVAVIHEYGLGHQTEKQFLRKGIENYRNNGRAARGKLLIEVIKGRVSPEAALRKLGRDAVKRVRFQIDKIDLIETGLLRETVTYEVTDSGLI